MANSYDLANLVFDPIEANHLIAYIEETTKENGGRIVLAKDSTADTIALDKTVGPANWKDKLDVIVKDVGTGKLFVSSTISIKDPTTGEWVDKIGVGEPNSVVTSQLDKAQETDAVKRAGFKWGIGRELRRTPNAYIPFDQLGFGDSEPTPLKTGNSQATNMFGQKLYKCNDFLEVLDVEYSGTGYDKIVSYLRIKNKNTGKVYGFGKSKANDDIAINVEPSYKPDIASEKVTQNEAPADATDTSKNAKTKADKKAVKRFTPSSSEKGKAVNTSVMINFGRFRDDPSPLCSLPAPQIVWARTHKEASDEVKAACDQLARENESLGKLFAQKGITV